MSIASEQDAFSWNLLHEFLTITRHESFAAAALAMGVSRPAIGQKIRKLERLLGFELIERLPGNRYFSLTAKGEEVRQLALTVETGLRKLRGQPVDTTGPAPVTAYEQAREIEKALHVLMKLLREQSPPRP